MSAAVSAHTTLVTGATGLLGSAVVRALCAAGRSVRVLLEPGADERLLHGLDVDRQVGDIRDHAAVERAVDGCGVVYHLAAIYKIWLADPGPMYEVNVEGTTNMLLAARAAGVSRVVHTSSIAAVGERPGTEPADETTLFDDWAGANDYVRSKVLAERIAGRFAIDGLDVTIVNPGFVMGPGDVAPTPTGEILVNLLRGRLPAGFKGGLSVVDVDDAAAGHLLAEQRGVRGERYILSNHNVSYREFFALAAQVAGIRAPRFELPRAAVVGVGFLAERLADITKRPPITTRGAMDYATRHIYFDNRKAKSVLGLPSRALEETLTRAVSWFRENGYV